jgi:hypothetical protein
MISEKMKTFDSPNFSADFRLSQKYGIESDYRPHPSDREDKELKEQEF